MAMRTATPWWASLAFGIGLLFFLFGERFFGHLPGPRFVLTGVGLLLIVGVAAVRVWAMLGSAGARRRVERALVICHAGTLLALILYAAGFDVGCKAVQCMPRTSYLVNPSGKRIVANDERYALAA
jgi:hypothetical protein